MFPSAKCDNPSESLFKSSSSGFPSDQNPSSEQDDPPFLFDLPSSVFDEGDLPLNQIFFQSQLLARNIQAADHGHHADRKNTYDPTKKEARKRNTNLAASKLDEKEAADRPISGEIVRRRNLGAIPRRRAGKKDRHSKICTAQGIRDRRMRLSLQAARKFFDLQDMLGYDKASKTIEWLFTKSKKAIKELTKGSHPPAIKGSNGDAKSESFVSECEVVSGIDQENSNVKINCIPPAADLMPLSCIDPFESTDERKPQSTACKTNIRESRDKARARARSRAREKMISKSLEYPGQEVYKSNPTGNDNLHKLGSSNSQFEGVEHESNSYTPERVSPCGTSFINSYQQQLSDVGTIEKLLGTSISSTSSCHISDYLCSAGYVDPTNNLMELSGNWDMLNTDRMNSIHHVGTNQVSLADNLNSSIYLAAANFP